MNNRQNFFSNELQLSPNLLILLMYIWILYLYVEDLILFAALLTVPSEDPHGSSHLGRMYLTLLGSLPSVCGV